MRKFRRRKFTNHQLLLSTMALLFTFLFVSAVWVEYSEARSRLGGRSFSRSRSFSRTPSRMAPGGTMNTPRRSSSFMRGLGGGLLGGFLGSMLFGGVGHAGMGGGFGGSGIGLFEILIIGGLIYFLYKKFSGRADPEGRRFFHRVGGIIRAAVTRCLNFTIPTAGHGVGRYSGHGVRRRCHGGTRYDPTLRSGI
jgi:uncharacterized membrane protein